MNSVYFQRGGKSNREIGQGDHQSSTDLGKKACKVARKRGFGETVMGLVSKPAEVTEQDKPS